MVVAHWTLVLVTALLPPDVQHTIYIQRQRHGHPVRHRPRRSPRACSSRPLPRASQHAAGPRFDAQEPGGSAVRREGRRARPDAAGDVADRARHVAARLVGFLREEPVERQSTGSWIQDRSRCHLRPVARPEWLLGRPHPAVLSAPRRRPSGSAGRDGGDDVERAASLGDQPVKGWPHKGSRPDQTRTAAPVTTESVPATSPRSASRSLPDASSAMPTSVNSAKVALVNQTFAKKFGLGNDAVGKSMGWAPGEGYPQQTRHDDRRSRRGRENCSEVKQTVPPQFFVPYRQDEGLGGMHVYLRTSGDVAQAASAITAVVKRLDPNLPHRGARDASRTGPQQHVSRSHDDDAVGGTSRFWPRCWRRSVSTASSPIPLHSARARSASAWRWEPRPTAFAAWCCVRLRS